MVSFVYFYYVIKKRLSITLGSDLRGRKSADAAFNLALSGIQKANHIFDALVYIGIHELNRVAQRKSFQPKYILQMVEKFTVTGASTLVLHSFYKVAAMSLETKKYQDSELIEKLYKGKFGLYSDRSLLWLWRFSTRQRKLNPKDVVSCLGQYDQNHSIDWDQAFSNQYKDLIVDIGSGMGVSLLNASTCSRKDKYQTCEETKGISWSLCNYAGTDLNQMMVRYANGILSRLDYPREEKFIHFFNLSAEEFLSNILTTYKGKVSLVMLQFPSPYRLVDKQNITGNSQLPTSAYDGFMVTEALLHMIAKVLQQNQGCGKLLIQTKCEDVAVFIKNLALDTGKFQMISCVNPIHNIDKDIYFQNGSSTRPKRVEQWLSSQIGIERAEGPYWSKSSLIPSIARTETEVASENDNTFIHRCLMSCSTKAKE